MINKTHTLLLLLITLSIGKIFSQITNVPLDRPWYFSTGDDDFENTTAWSGGIAPGNNMVLLINSGDRITISNNVGTYNDLIIVVLAGGELFFNESVKLKMDANSVISLEGGSPGGRIIPENDANNSQQIQIGSGQSEWRSKDGILEGPLSIQDGDPNETVLPITLDFFEVTLKNKTVKFMWQTSQELENDFFTIEKSLDLETWEEITTLSGAGTSNHTINYEYEELISEDEIIYYRLKQTDYDHNYSYSQTEVITNVINTSQFYPNPCDKTLTIEKDDIENSPITILDKIGQEQHSNIIYHQDKIIIETSELKSGMYVIHYFHNLTHYSEIIKVIH